MSDTPKKFYLTTPIYYVNARPHIGHAYTTIVADVLARRHRLLGDDTFFLTGTDEHGQKIERSAAAAGIEPQQFADQVSAQFRSLWDRMGLTYDRYIRTTDPAHKRGVQKLFAELYARDQINLSTYTGQYSIGEEMFVDGPPGTIGPDGKPTETVTEENFFFKLSGYQLPLLNLIESNELLITPESSRNEVLRFLRGQADDQEDPTQDAIQGAISDAHFDAIYESHPYAALGRKGAVRLALERDLIKVSSPSDDFPEGQPYVVGALRDLSVSRSSFTWGIPVPEPAASESKQNHVIYVWLDALANYMTAIGYGSDAPADEEEFKRYWPADLHLVGKEITRFHCVYWPAFLLAAGLPLPKQITAHGWLLFDNSKMSKSKGNIVRTETILEAFGEHVYAKQFPESSPRDRDLFASDVLRYHLLREIPFGQDGSFSFDAMITRYNADLANGYGNLVSRTLNMIQQNFAGVVPTPVFEVPGTTPIDTSVVATAAFASQARIGALRETDFSAYLTEVAAFITSIDGFISSAAPWKLAKDPARAEELATVLYLAAEALRWITGLLYPILPAITARVWAQLGLGDIEFAAKSGELKNLIWGGLQPGTKLGPLAPIFPRAPKELAQIMTDMENPETQNSPDSKVTTGQNPSSLDSSSLPAVHTPGSTDPDAGPRTASPTEPIGTLPVAGSTAHTTGPDATPSHTQAQPSGIFAGQPPVTTDANTSPQIASQIAIDDFIKIDLRVAQIVVAERIPKADKLLRLEVDLGYERRQILSGIAEFYTPEELIGRRIVIIANLAPRKMRGLESHGMLLAASEGEHGKPVLATMAEDIALGSRLK